MNAVARTDEELMLAHANGAEGAFRELFQRYAPTLLRMLERLVRRPADAQDLVQQTFLQLHRARAEFRPGAPLRPWIFCIARNLARDLIRRRVRHKETPVEEQTLPVSVAVQPAFDVDLADGLGRRVRAALEELSRDQREVIELHWFQELSYDEIASIVGGSAGAARVRAHRGYSLLRRRLGVRDDELGRQAVRQAAS